MQAKFFTSWRSFWKISKFFQKNSHILLFLNQKRQSCSNCLQVKYFAFYLIYKQLSMLFDILKVISRKGTVFLNNYYSSREEQWPYVLNKTWSGELETMRKTKKIMCQAVLLWHFKYEIKPIMLNFKGRSSIWIEAFLHIQGRWKQHEAAGAAIYGRHVIIISNFCELGAFFVLT